MFNLVILAVPASTPLSVVTTQNGRKMLVIDPLGVRLWGQHAVELAKLHKAGEDAVLMGYLRPLVTQNGNVFPAVVVTSVRSAKATVQESTDLDDILGDESQASAPERPKRKGKSLAEALSD